ncbi:MAG: hypothetical protein E3J21_26545 [Anaerolineales bacterium]|nr:MAG: hypothetical protein E3J21_26545 [Anaerolineales bacterium]
MDVERARQVKQQYVNTLLAKRNVVACGVGYKESGGVMTDELCVVVSVEKKVPLAQLTEADMVPQAVDDVKTDVLETGLITAWQAPTQKWRPAPGGVSIGHINITAGTLGCLVLKGGELFILSNNHVLADSNLGKKGDPIIQPGKHDGGTLADKIATLEEFVRIDFGTSPTTCSTAKAVEELLNAIAKGIGSGHRMMSYQESEGENRVDAALARPLSLDLVERRILNIGVPKGSRKATLGTNVKKSGRTTGFTTGRITQIDATVQVSYGSAGTATFTDQFVAGGMSSGGDSGSAVLDEEDYVVGLLFAGSQNTTIINPIQFVLDALGIAIAT